LLISHLERKEHSVGQFDVCLSFVVIVVVVVVVVVVVDITVFCLFVSFPPLVMSRKKILSTNKLRSRSFSSALISTVFVDCLYNHHFFYFILFFFTVPFRDSVLTKLLKNALGGNSKTIMVSSHSLYKSGSKDHGQQ